MRLLLGKEARVAAGKALPAADELRLAEGLERLVEPTAAAVGHRQE